MNLIPAATDPALLDAELGTCLDLGVPAMCFFWDVVPSAVARAKAAGCLVLHQVGSLDAALAAEAAGADVLIVQGVEAGGHVHGTVACARAGGTGGPRGRSCLSSPRADLRPGQA